MAHPGPDKGAQPRTLRRVALAKGAASEGFEGGINYDPQGGHPITPDMPKGEYKDRAESAIPTGTKTSQGIKPF